MSDTVTELDPEILSEEEKQAQADFDEGAAMGTEGPKATTTNEADPPRGEDGRFVSPKVEEEPVKKPETKPNAKTNAKPAAGKPAPKVEEKPADPPKYVQITEEQYKKLEAAAERTGEFEKQFSKAFGTIGDMQKILRGLQANTPRGLAVKMPDGAFDAMKKDFPELADHMQTTMEGILKGIEGTGAPSADLDPEEFERKLEERVLKLAAEDLADEFPDWQKIVGAVNVKAGEAPDPNNAFRKWLATKPQEYQDRINSTNSAGVITRAIRMFKSETKTPATPAKPNKRVETRNNRIAEAVRPRGDGGHPPAKSADDDFEAGFKSG